MEDRGFKKNLPAEYHENALTLLAQSPKVLYAYWELSPGLKSTLSDKNKVQIRLNIEGGGISHKDEIDMVGKSYYFENVQPGLSYYCEIGMLNSDNIFLPLLRSNTVSAPQDQPGSVSSSEANSPSSVILSAKLSDKKIY